VLVFDENSILEENDFALKKIKFRIFKKDMKVL
jgi:hypothetical protein